MVRLTRKERQDKVNLLASINKVNIGDEVEATDNGKWGNKWAAFVVFIVFCMFECVDFVLLCTLL